MDAPTAAAIAHARQWLACNPAATMVWVGLHSGHIFITKAAALAAGEPVITVSATPAQAPTPQAPTPKAPKAPKATTPKPE